MNSFTKNKKILPIVFSLGMIVIAYFFNENFRYLISKDTSESIFWITVPIFVFSIIVFFLNTSMWNLWFKFSLFFYAFALIISFFPLSTTRDFAPSIQEIFIYIFSILYTIISIILIIYKSIKKS